MLVVDPVPLRDFRGETLNKPCASMHVLGGKDLATKICHYRPSRWVPDNTLYLVALKGRVWLEAYDAHLRTGKPLDNFLRHMAEEQGHPAASSTPVSEDERTFTQLLRGIFG
ncbi:hypothetical protein ACTG9Q_13230 [Actinokineospora sp. 24-640]